MEFHRLVSSWWPHPPPAADIRPWEDEARAAEGQYRAPWFQLVKSSPDVPVPGTRYEARSEIRRTEAAKERYGAGSRTLAHGPKNVTSTAGRSSVVPPERALSSPIASPVPSPSRSASGRLPAPTPREPSKGQANIWDSLEICPFCDEPLHRPLSDRLGQMYAAALSHSWASKRYTNPHGLEADASVTMPICYTHRKEAEAAEGGPPEWPEAIDFAQIPARLSALKPALEYRIENPEMSVFYQSLMKVYEEMGSRKAAGLRGQHESFILGQPGYYGERGTIRITDALLEIFGEIYPPETSTASPADFISFVMVPEAALLLIQEDLQVDRQAAVRILEKSRAWGLAHHPDDGSSSAAPSPRRENSPGAGPSLPPPPIGLERGSGYTAGRDKASSMKRAGGGPQRNKSVRWSFDLMSSASENESMISSPTSSQDEYVA